MKFKIKFADQIVGLFILISLVAFSGIIIIMGINQRWFAKNYYFKSVFNSSANIAPGTGIQMRGFQIGKIDKVTLNDENQVDVEFYIYDTYYYKVKESSLLELSVSPIGLGSALLFHPGKEGDVLPEGSFIPTADSVDGQSIIEQELADIPVKDDTITRLLSNVNPVLENVNRTLVAVTRTLTEVNRAIAGQGSGPLTGIVGDINAATSKLPATMDNVNSVVDSVDEVVIGVQDRVAVLLDQVEELLQATQTTVANVNGITGNLEETTDALRDPTGLIPKLLDPQGSLKTILDDDDALFNRIIAITDNVERSVRNLQQIISSLNSEVPKIASVLNETKSAIEKAQDVLEGVKNNPLIRGGVPERAVQESLYNSMREGSFDE